MRTLAYAAMFLFATTTGSWAVDLKLGYFAADGHPRDVAADQFKANVEKRTSGQVAVSLFGNNAPGSPPEVPEQVLMGAVDMSLSGQDQIAKHLPFHDAISTPFAFPSYEVADKVIDGPFKEWSDPELTKKGLVHLSDREWGFRQLTNSRKPVFDAGPGQGQGAGRRRQLHQVHGHGRSGSEVIGRERRDSPPFFFHRADNQDSGKARRHVDAGDLRCAVVDVDARHADRGFDRPDGGDLFSWVGDGARFW